MIKIMLFSALFGAVSFAYADTHYVNKANPAPSGSFTTWGSAATSIQDAVDAADSNDVVLVASGVYNTGGRANAGAGSLTNRVVITNFVTVMAVSANPADTLIVGAPDPGTGSNGPAAIRCVYLYTNCTLIGFTLTNGYAVMSNTDSGRGAGAFCASASSSILSNCVITSCMAIIPTMSQIWLPKATSFIPV